LSVIAYRLLLSPVSSTNKSDRHDITEKLLKAALNSITSNHPNVKKYFKITFVCNSQIVMLEHEYMKLCYHLVFCVGVFCFFACFYFVFVFILFSLFCLVFVMCFVYFGKQSNYSWTILHNTHRFKWKYVLNWNNNFSISIIVSVE
jgi:hypothetical protein